MTEGGTHTPSLSLPLSLFSPSALSFSLCLPLSLPLLSLSLSISLFSPSLLYSDEIL